MVRKILTENFKQNCKHNSDVESNKQLIKDLIETLAVNKHGYTISTNQIGEFNNRICIVNVIEPLVFVNPVIVKTETPIVYMESSLSFPNKLIKTKRFSYVKIKCDNYQDELELGYNDIENIKTNDIQLMEAVFVQQAIDMLNGKSIMDVKLTTDPIRVENKLGRNTIVKIQNIDTQEIKEVKYKKFQQKYTKEWKILN